MKNYKTLILLVLIIFSNTLIMAQRKTKFPKLIEVVEKKNDEISIPYKKYELKNGLTLIVHEDHSDPIVHVDVTYHVGSAREVPGRSGFAHFFEHMMFQGSENVADEEHFKIIEGAGGDMNGTTNKDRTNYFETLPSNYLEIALWLEADRMGFLLDAVTQEKFEIQRATVKNERQQNYDNRPYGLVWEKISQAMYPEGHAYSWPTIGYIEELNEANLVDLKNFFLEWYGPNNATLTVAGDVDTETVVELANKYFGSINRGVEIPELEKLRFFLDSDRYVSYEDDIRFPMIQMIFPTVPARDKDEAPLDVLSHILGGNKNSIFYKNFDKPQNAIQSSVYHPCMELHGNMHLVVIPFPGKSLSEMENLMRKSIQELYEKGFNQEEIERYKSSKEAEFIFQLESVSGKASKLASYQTYTKNPNYINEDIARYQNVTLQDVERVFEEYILNKYAVILSVVPKEKSDLVAHVDNYYSSNTVKTGLTFEEKNINYKKPKDSFDRSLMPKHGANPIIKVPEYWTQKLENNLKIIGINNNEIPAIGLQISIPMGHRNELMNHAGIANLVASLMNESTKNYTIEEITQQLEMLGSEINVSSSKENITIFIKSLEKNLDKTLNILEEIMFNPGFYEDDFNRIKTTQLESIENQNTDASTLANNIFNVLLYGKNHIYSTPNIGTLESVQNISLDDAHNYYIQYFSPAKSKVVVVGSVDKKTILLKLNFLNKWSGEKHSFNNQGNTPKIDKTQIYLYNKEGAPQSEIRIGYLTDMQYDATDEYFKSVVMNYQLGGNFNSRINSNLREDKGITYGAFSYFNSTNEPGPFVARAGVKGESTDLAITEFIKELSNYNKFGITNDELTFTKNSIGQSEALSYETLSKKARFLRRILTYDLPSTYLETQNNILENISKKEIDSLANKHLIYDKMVIVVVGDSASLYPQLEKLDYEITLVDEHGVNTLGLDSISSSLEKINTLTIPASKEKAENSESTYPIVIEAENFELAYRKATKKTGYSKNSLFIYNGITYSAEHKIIKPLNELDLKAFSNKDLFVVEELFFQLNSSTLTKQQIDIISSLADKIKSNDYTITLTGLSSEFENNRSNLSNERVTFFYNLLKENGVKNILISNKNITKLSFFKDERANYLNRCVLFEIN